MKNLVNEMVTVEMENVVIAGMVFDATEDMRYIHIETEKDFYCVDTTQYAVEVVKEEVKEVSLLDVNEKLIEDFLNEKGFEWDAYSCGGELTYDIVGDKYNVMLSVDEEGIFTIETTHNERAKAEDSKPTWEQDHSKAWANAVTRKTLKGALNYTLKYLEK